MTSTLKSNDEKFPSSLHKGGLEQPLSFQVLAGFVCSHTEQVDHSSLAGEPCGLRIKGGLC